MEREDGAPLDEIDQLKCQICDCPLIEVEKLENRDAPKVAGGGLDDGSLSRGGGKPQKA